MCAARVLRVVALFHLCLSTTSVSATTIPPATAFMARLIRGENVIVGNGQENTPVVNEFLTIKEATSDRVVLEYDVRSLPKTARAILNLEMSNMDLPNIEPITIYSFEGNGLANAADYFHVQNAVATFSDEGTVCEPIIVLGVEICLDTYKLYTVDVTEAYRVSSGFLGLVLKAERGSARYSINGVPTLSIVVPEPAAIPTALLGVLFASRFGVGRRRCRRFCRRRGGGCTWAIRHDRSGLQHVASPLHQPGPAWAPARG